MNGVYKSQNPNMRITGEYGEIINEDGSVQQIVFSNMHGSFGIYLYDATSRGNQGECLFSGDYRQKGDTITLKTFDGKEILLNKVPEEYELDKLYNQEMEYAYVYDQKQPINEKYAKLWFEKIDFYYNFLINNYKGDKELIIQTQNNWNNYANYQINNYKNYFNELYYENNKITNFFISEKEHELYRDRAVELYLQCIHLVSDVPTM